MPAGGHSKAMAEGNSAEKPQQYAIRLNKFIADSGQCSRREADALINEGRVLVDGEIAVLGQRIVPGQTVTLDGQPVVPLDQPVYLLLHKPLGITCTTDRRRSDNIIDYINYPQRIFPVGRLDRDSEGLILLTNDGSIVNKMLRGHNKHEKEYRVTVDKPLTPEFIRQMSEGVEILDTVTLPARLIQEKQRVFRIILTQGLNRQIRRMCEALGYEVKRLVRIRIMHLSIGKLPYGQFRPLTYHETAELKRLLADSSGEPMSAEAEEDFDFEE